MEATLVNGENQSVVSVTNRGLAYGDGLFETIKVSAGRAEFYPLHRQRLQRGCERLKIACDFDVLDQEVSRLLAEAGIKQGILKIIVTRAFTHRGYQFEAGAGSERIISLLASANDCSRQQQQGVSVRLCAVRLAANPALAGIKHLARLENVLARAEWTDDAIAEGLLLDPSDRVVEGTMSNVFACANGVVFTPSLAECGVEGIIRQLIVSRLAHQINRPVEIRSVNVDDLLGADEVFVCNSLIGIWPVVTIGGKQFSVGPITRQLQKALQTMAQRGE